MSAPTDIIPMDLVRRQGDVSGTLIQVAPNGQAANIGGWTFVFSVQPGAALQTVTWIPPIGNSTGLPMTTVDGSGITIPGYNSTFAATFISTTGILAGDYLFIPGWGIVQVKSVTDGSHLVLYNSSFPNNASSGTVAPGINVFEASNMGYTVLVIPSTITDWNSTAAVTPNRSVGKFPYYLKYDTTDPSPGPFKKTFYMGNLYIVSQNDPTA